MLLFSEGNIRDWREFQNYSWREFEDLRNFYLLWVQIEDVWARKRRKGTYGKGGVKIPQDNINSFFLRPLKKFQGILKVSL